MREYTIKFKDGTIETVEADWFEHNIYTSILTFYEGEDKVIKSYDVLTISKWRYNYP